MMRATGKVLKQPVPRWRRVARVLFRIGLVALFLGVLVVGWAYHSARAQMSENFFGLGTQMMAYEHATHQDAPRDLVINGQTMHLSSGTTTRSTTEVLDYFEARCDAADGQLGLQIAQLRADHPEVEPPHDAPENPTLREDDGRNGYVACLDLGRSSVAFDELFERIARFGETGDVAEIGDTRFVFAEQSGEGDETRTHFVGLWTEGEFNVNRMFPETGDAPGGDVDGVSRPPQARRMLSGHERGLPHSITVYWSRLGEAELEAFYRRDLSRNGWSLLESADGRAAGAPPTLIAERDERMVTLIFQPDPEREGAQAAIFDGR